MVAVAKRHVVTAPVSAIMRFAHHLWRSNAWTDGIIGLYGHLYGLNPHA